MERKFTQGDLVFIPAKIVKVLPTRGDQRNAKIFLQLNQGQSVVTHPHNVIHRSEVGVVEVELPATLSMTLDDTSMPKTVVDSLKAAGVTTIGELSELTKEEVLSIKGIGEASLEAITAVTPLKEE